jgi:hypothetical protein
MNASLTRLNEPKDDQTDSKANTDAGSNSLHGCLTNLARKAGTGICPVVDGFDALLECFTSILTPQTEQKLQSTEEREAQNGPCTTRVGGGKFTVAENTANQTKERRSYEHGIHKSLESQLDSLRISHDDLSLDY